MEELYPPNPYSSGIFLSYRCNVECRHCMYACSPRWRDKWISERDLEKILIQLSGRIQAGPLGPDSIGINYGLHFTGGEPFLNFNLLLKASLLSSELKIPSTFVETNCFWCTNGRTVEEKLMLLKESGLDGILISINPFTIEHIAFKRVERAVEISNKIFGRNVLIYQEAFYHLFKRLNIESFLSFEKFVQKIGVSSLETMELIPMGRMPYRLGHLYKKRDARHFFASSCKDELTRAWHTHIDNHCNYISGYCGGISLGDGRDIDSLCSGINLDERPILKALVTDLEEFYNFAVKKFGYRERDEGYISKCHLCIDMRKHIALQTDEFRELRPKEFYNHIE